MQIHQIDKPLPVRVVDSNGWLGPTGKGMAILIWKDHLDHHLTWYVVFDDPSWGGWEIENPHIRFDTNITWGRVAKDAKPYIPQP